MCANGVDVNASLPLLQKTTLEFTRVRPRFRVQCQAATVDSNKDLSSTLTYVIDTKQTQHS